MSQGLLEFDGDVISNVVDCPDVGLHRDIPFEAYAAWNAVNSGVIKWGMVSPKHFHAAYNGDLKSEDSAAMKLGRAVHCMLLEPETFESRFITSSNCSAKIASGPRKGEFCGKRGSLMAASGDWYCGVHQPAELAEHGMEVISADQYQQCVGMRESLKSHPAMKLLRRKGWSEVSIVWELHGLKMKGRLDRGSLEGSRPMILDIKKCRVGKGTKEECERSVLNYGYHIQAAGYVRGVEQLTGTRPEFLWVFVEDNPPYDIQILPMDETCFDVGWHEVNRIVEHYTTCVTRNNIHGYIHFYGDGPEDNTIKSGGLPLWYLKQQMRGME